MGHLIFLRLKCNLEDVYWNGGIPNEASDIFRTYSLSLMFLNPHLAGTKIYPVISLSMNLTKNEGGVIWEGRGSSPAKFAGDDRVDLQVWLNDEKRFLTALEIAIEKAVAGTVKWYQKAL